MPGHELFDRVRRSLARVREQGHRVYYDEQREWLDDYWATADVEVEGAPAGIQQAVRWNLFQMLRPRPALTSWVSLPRV